MTLLIIGGLLAVAFLAILGAVFLSLNDQRPEKANGSVNVNSSASTPLVDRSSASNSITERTTSLNQNLPATTGGSLSPTAGDQQPYELNGQFRELTAELQTLHQHAWELERHLRTLAEVADRIEKNQTNQIGAGE